MCLFFANKFKSYDNSLPNSGTTAYLPLQLSHIVSLKLMLRQTPLGNK